MINNFFWLLFLLLVNSLGKYGLSNKYQKGMVDSEHIYLAKEVFEMAIFQTLVLVLFPFINAILPAVNPLPVESRRDGKFEAVNGSKSTRKMSLFLPP